MTNITKNIHHLDILDIKPLFILFKVALMWLFFCKNRRRLLPQWCKNKRNRWLTNFNSSLRPNFVNVVENRDRKVTSYDK